MYGFFFTSLLCLNVCYVLQCIIGHLFVYFILLLYTIGVIVSRNQIGSTSHHVFRLPDQNSDSEYEYVFVFCTFFLSSMSSQILLRSESLCEYLGDGVKNTQKTMQHPDETSYQTHPHVFLIKPNRKRRKTGRSSDFTRFFWSFHKKHNNIEDGEERKKNLTKYLISFWIEGRERRPTPGSPSVASRRWMGQGFHGADSAPTHLSVVGNLLSISALDAPNPARRRHATATSRHSSAAVKRRWKNRPTSVRLAVAPFWSSSAWAKSPLIPSEQT